MLGTDPAIGVWATVSVRRDGVLVQVDRGGHPTINPFINPNDVKDQFNVRRPADDVANYLGPWSRLLEDNGYTSDGAAAAARIVLPDILRYDRSQPAAYPNGRTLADDVPCLGPPNLLPGRLTSRLTLPRAAHETPP
jgi:Domain of unknown function (DUF4331)